jgi:hypothetical protein
MADFFSKLAEQRHFGKTLVSPKNSIRRFYQPPGHASNWLMIEPMVTKEH